MVVVAIIGLLSAVAVPSFKKYTIKARTTEAKLHLSSIFAAEKTAFQEYNTYVSCLGAMGLNYDFNSSLYSIWDSSADGQVDHSP
jgi:type IV pilus assembly protein PilA